MTPDKAQLEMAARLRTYADEIDSVAFDASELLPTCPYSMAANLRGAAKMLERPLMIFQTLPVRQWEDEDHGHDHWDGDMDKLRQEFRERLYVEPPCIGPGSELKKTAQEIYDSVPKVDLSDEEIRAIVDEWSVNRGS